MFKYTYKKSFSLIPMLMHVHSIMFFSGQMHNKNVFDNIDMFIVLKIVLYLSFFKNIFHIFRDFIAF